MSDPDLDHVLALELALLDPRVRRSPDLVAALLDPDFSEVGSSGRRYDAEQVAERLAAEGHDSGRGHPVASARDVRTVSLAPGLALLTYAARSDRGTALRCSLWRRDDTGGWRLLYSQGTPVPDGA